VAALRQAVRDALAGQFGSALLEDIQSRLGASGISAPACMRCTSHTS